MQLLASGKRTSSQLPSVRYIQFDTLTIAYYFTAQIHLFARVYIAKRSQLGSSSRAHRESIMSDTDPTQEELNDVSLCGERLWDLDENRLEEGADYEINVGVRNSQHYVTLHCCLCSCCAKRCYYLVYRFFYLIVLNQDL